MIRYKYILFDADNTIFDFDRCEREAFRSVLASYALGYSDEVYNDYHVINEGLWKLLEVGGIERSLLKTERFRLLFEKYGVFGTDYLGAARDYENGKKNYHFHELPTMVASTDSSRANRRSRRAKTLV